MDLRTQKDELMVLLIEKYRFIEGIMNFFFNTNKIQIVMWLLYSFIIFKGHLNIVKLLIDSKANVELQDEDGQTALHRSAAGGHLDVSKLLLEKQPNLKEVADVKDKIPFEYLAKNANDDFKILLKP